MTEDTPTRLAAIKLAEYWERGRYGDKGLRLCAEETAQILRDLLTEHARLQAERDSANARFCDQHSGEYKTSGCVVCGLMAQGTDLHALHVRIDAAEAARDEAQRELDVWRTSPENMAEQFKEQRDEAQRQTAALRAALEQIATLAPDRHSDPYGWQAVRIAQSALAAGTVTP